MSLRKKKLFLLFFVYFFWLVPYSFSGGDVSEDKRITQRFRQGIAAGEIIDIVGATGEDNLEYVRTICSNILLKNNEEALHDLVDDKIMDLHSLRGRDPTTGFFEDQFELDLDKSFFNTEDPAEIKTIIKKVISDPTTFGACVVSNPKRISYRLGLKKTFEGIIGYVQDSYGNYTVECKRVALIFGINGIKNLDDSLSVGAFVSAYVENNKKSALMHDQGF